MLTKFKLVNVPKGGVDHLVDGRRFSINQNLTDEDAEFLTKAGLGKYFKPQKLQTNGQKQPTQPTPSAGAIDAGSQSGPEAPNNAV